jgi:hypothetical protein
VSTASTQTGLKEAVMAVQGVRKREELGSENWGILETMKEI